MKNKISPLLLISSLCLAASGLAGTEDYSKSSKEVIQKKEYEPRFYISVAPGGEFDEHATKFLGNGSGNVILPGGGPTLPIKIQSRDFTALHDPVFTVNVESGYKISDLLTVYSAFAYSHASASTHGAGRLSDPAGVFGTVGGVYEVEARVSEYQTFTGRLGTKVTLPRTLLDIIHAPSFITPFFDASIGAKHVRASHVNLAAGPFDYQMGLYQDDWVLSSELQFGYDFKVCRNFSVVLESGYGYDTKPESSPNRVPGVSSINGSGDRFYSTVSLGGKFTF